MAMKGKKDKISFGEIDMAAKRGLWDFVDANLEPFLDKARFEWALEMLKDQNRNTRDLAATILNRTTFTLSDAEQKVLIEQMSDLREYHIVRYRLAVALCQRGNRDPQVLAVMEEAYKDPDVGELARKFKPL
jgi:hypothetical protein